MDTCDYLVLRVTTQAGLVQGCIWCFFTVTWLLVTCFVPRAVSLSFDLFVAFVTAMRALSGLLLAFLVTDCIWEEEPRLLAFSLVTTFSEGLFAMLQLMISRGVGLIRYQLSRVEKAVVVVVSCGLMAGLQFPGVELMYWVCYAGVVVYGSRTVVLLHTRIPAPTAARVHALTQKRSLFTTVILLIAVGVLLSLGLSIGQRMAGGRSEFEDYYLAGFCAVQMLFVGELLLLQTRRGEEEFSMPLVTNEDVLIRT